MHLVGDDDIGVERVLTVGRRSQGIDRDIPVSDIARYAVLIVAAYDTQPVVGVLVYGYAETLYVEFEEVKALQGLLQRAADLIHL